MKKEKLYELLGDSFYSHFESEFRLGNVWVCKEEGCGITIYYRTELYDDVQYPVIVTSGNGVYVFNNESDFSNREPKENLKLVVDRVSISDKPQNEIQDMLNRKLSENGVVWGELSFDYEGYDEYCVGYYIERIVEF